jgi:hypothetical protein
MSKQELTDWSNLHPDEKARARGKALGRLAEKYSNEYEKLIIEEMQNAFNSRSPDARYFVLRNGLDIPS